MKIFGRVDDWKLCSARSRCHGGSSKSGLLYAKAKRQIHFLESAQVSHSGKVHGEEWRDCKNIAECEWDV